MKTSLINPSTGIYPAEDYAHGIQLTGFDKLLLVAGTMGLLRNSLLWSGTISAGSWPKPIWGSTASCV